MSDDYEPIPDPNFLEKIVAIILAIISAIFWRKK